jgi:Ca2+-transporting ATPase
MSTFPGLSTAEAAARLAADGPNALHDVRPPSAWGILARQFAGLVMWVLLGAVAVSLILGDWIEAVAIAAIVVLNGVVGFLQEWRAESALAALQLLGAPRGRVVRDGQEIVVPAVEVVHGDLILLEAGDIVAADARLVDAAGLETNESLLTGESLPVAKRAAGPPLPGAPLPGAPVSGAPVSGARGAPGERDGFVFAGTSVTRGSGRATVTAIGMATELGRIAGLLGQAGRDVTPLQRRLDQMSRRLIILCAFIVVVLLILGVARGEAFLAMLQAALSLAVAAIPEGLPTVVTVALAVGTRRMARRHALVRHMAAIETLGAAQVICSDKTGTLTTGDLRARRIWTPAGGRGALRRLLRAAAAASDATLRGDAARPEILGDPTEGALLLAAAGEKIDRLEIESLEPRALVLPFDAERKRMSIVRHSGDGLMVYVKGAPETVLPLCTRVAGGDEAAGGADAAVENGDTPLDEAMRRRTSAETLRFAAEALRVLAVAERRLPPGPLCGTSDAIESNFTFLGLAALADAPRPEAREAIARCAAAGIRVVMITGDHPVTGAVIARELGILRDDAGGESVSPGGAQIADGSDPRVLDGRALDVLDDDELAAAAQRVAVYARVTPSHKLRIVRALKRDGLVVAMTGDGVNDAPAVREASVGIAMGRSGTEVTRQAADIIIGDDNFASIVNAVEEGRRIFDNIRRTLLYLLAGNTGEVLVMLVAVLAGWPIPLLPVQLLWVNLVTDGFPALALATERVHAQALLRPPRPVGSGFADSRFVRRLVLAASLIALVSLAGFWVGYRHEHDVESGRSLAFAVLVTSHIAWAMAARSWSRTFLRIGPLTNLRLIGVVTATFVMQVIVQSTPALARLFGVAPLGWRQWSIVAVLGLVPVTAIEILKILTPMFRPGIIPPSPGTNINHSRKETP